MNSFELRHVGSQVWYEDCGVLKKHGFLILVVVGVCHPAHALSYIVFAKVFIVLHPESCVQGFVY